MRVLTAFVLTVWSGLSACKSEDRGPDASMNDASKNDDAGGTCGTRTGSLEREERGADRVRARRRRVGVGRRLCVHRCDEGRCGGGKARGLASSMKALKKELKSNKSPFRGLKSHRRGAAVKVRKARR
jgi:hypothetical protein